MRGELMIGVGKVCELLELYDDKRPVYVQLSYSDEEIRGYMENAGIKNGFFTVKMGDREATQFYSALKQQVNSV